MMPRTSALAPALLACLAAVPARAVTAVSNVDNPDPTGYTSPLEAMSFTTGDQPAILNSISARYDCTSSSFGMDMTAHLNTDTDGHPSTLLEVFPEQTGPAGHGTVTFPSAGTYLAPHTTYWFYLDTKTNAFWETTTDLTESSSYGWTIGDQLYYLPGPAAGRFSVDVTFVPEPAAVSLLVLPTLALFPRRRHRNSENRP